MVFHLKAQCYLECAELLDISNGEVQLVVFQAYCSLLDEEKVERNELVNIYTTNGLNKNLRGRLKPVTKR